MNALSLARFRLSDFSRLCYGQYSHYSFSRSHTCCLLGRLGQRFYICPQVQVAESSPGSIGAPVPFFVRRPDATDVSETLGRFAVDGLVTLFQREVRAFPKRNTRRDEKLIVVPGPESASDNPVEHVEPEPPAKTSKAAASKGKGGNKNEIEQPPLGDGGVEARWRAIRSEVQSNRCLVIGAGENFSLATLPLFSELGVREAEGRCESGPSACGGQGSPEGSLDGGQVSEQSNAKEDDAPGVYHDGTNAVEKNKIVNEALASGEPAMRIDRASCFVVCLDFRLDLAEALLNIKDGKGELARESGHVAGGEGRQSSDDKVIRIMSCGDNVEISAVIRLWTPIDAPVIHAEAEHSTETGGSDATAALTSGEASSLEPPTTDASARSGAFEGADSTTRLSERSGDSDAKAPPTPTWYLHSILVRSGSYLGTVSCVGPVEPAVQRQELIAAETAADTAADTAAVFAAGSSDSHGTRGPSLSSESVVCELAEWHALALIANHAGDDTPVVLFVDGDILPLRPDTGSDAKEGTTCGDSELLASGAVVMGGTGREWTALAVKNLAVYNQTPGIEQLQATTRVFRALREDQQAAKAADEQEDQLWLEEARKAKEEEREPGETTSDMTQATTL